MIPGWLRSLFRAPPLADGEPRVIDMGPVLAELDPDTTPFYTMLMRLSHGPPPTWAERMAEHRRQVEFWDDWDDIFPEPKEPRGLMGQKVEWLEDELFPRLT